MKHVNGYLSQVKVLMASVMATTSPTNTEIQNTENNASSSRAAESIHLPRLAGYRHLVGFTCENKRIVLKGASTTNQYTPETWISSQSHVSRLRQWLAQH